MKTLPMSARDFLTQTYLQYRNDFLSPEGFAAYHGLDIQAGIELITLAKVVFYSKHPEA